MALDFLFGGDKEDDETIAAAQIVADEATAKNREVINRSKRLKTLLDSPTWKDVLFIIGELKKKASDEARHFDKSEFLYGIDFLTQLEKEIVVKSQLA